MQAQLRMEVPVEHIGSVFSALQRHAAERQAEEYGADGALRLTVSVAERAAGPLAALVRDSTAGRVTAEAVPA